MEMKSEVKKIFTVNKLIEFLAFFVGVYVGKLISSYLPKFAYSEYIYGIGGAVGVIYGLNGGLLNRFVLGIGAELAVANLMPLLPKI